MEIPAHDCEIFNEKKSDAVLVIPVINEGNKIRKQLKDIKDCNFKIDVIISDGGSSDGSVEHEFLRLNGVRALLTKLDEGKLSSQLRIAYHWALQERYMYILTIDGNGKDDITLIPRIHQKLIDGYDYVQGSRYIKGGISKNTPIDRFIANRFFHAPIISLATLTKFSDTTNGFRGYSTRFLLDDRVKPFREIFRNYELLFYLTVRAAKLNFKVCEVPVTRIYPKSGPTPTKLSTFSSKITILKETILACLGYYNP